MKRYLLSIALLCLVATGANAYWQSRAQVAISGGGGGGYQGPGDIVGGATVWVSSARAYSAAFAAGGTAVMDLVDQAGLNPITINILPTGFVDVSAITTWVAAHSVTTIKVSQFYDQTGNGNHLAQATGGLQATITLSALNGLPGMTSAAAVVLQTGNLTQTQPFSFSYVSKRTGAFTTLQDVFSITGGTAMSGYAASTNTAELFAGTALTATASDSAFHAFETVANNTSSALVIDGSATTGTAGAAALSATPLRFMSSNGGGVSLTGIVMEAGFWPGAFNATQYGNLNTNQHDATNGYNF